MERDTSNSWFLVRAGAMFKEALALLLPDIDVYQPKRVVRHYNRRLRKKIRREELVLPGYAFVRGVRDLALLRVTSEFHGLVRVGGEVVILAHATLQEFHTSLTETPCGGTSCPQLDEEFMHGQQVVMGSSSIFSGFNATILKVLGDTLRVEVMGPFGSLVKAEIPRHDVATT